MNKEENKVEETTKILEKKYYELVKKNAERGIDEICVKDKKDELKYKILLNNYSLVNGKFKSEEEQRSVQKEIMKDSLILSTYKLFSKDDEIKLKYFDHKDTVKKLGNIVDYMFSEIFKEEVVGLKDGVSNFDNLSLEQARKEYIDKINEIEDIEKDDFTIKNDIEELIWKIEFNNYLLARNYFLSRKEEKNMRTGIVKANLILSLYFMEKCSLETILYNYKNNDFVDEICDIVECLYSREFNNELKRI